jgi:hypothetical protein
MTGPARILQNCVRNPVFGARTRAAYTYSRLRTTKTGLTAQKTGLMTQKTGLISQKNAELLSDSNAAGGG